MTFRDPNGPAVQKVGQVAYIPMDPDSADESNPVDKRPDLRRAAITVGSIVAFGVLFLIASALTDGTLSVTFTVAAPLVVLLCSAGVMRHTYRVWRANGLWQVWQGATWLTLASFVMLLFITAPTLMG